MKNRLQLTIIPFSYSSYDEYGNTKETYTTQIGEFIIDDKPLAEWFGIERNLGNCDTDMDTIPAIERRFISGLKAEVPPFNQFGTNTITLYRCHCGCDYCGVISTEIVVTDNHVIWQNVGYENDFKIDENKLDTSEKWQLKRLIFTFDKAEYLAEIQRFSKNLKKEN